MNYKYDKKDNQKTLSGQMHKPLCINLDYVLDKNEQY